jgi:hypothetical protein
MFLLSSVYLVHWHARILFLKERNLCDFSLQTQAPSTTRASLDLGSGVAS